MAVAHRIDAPVTAFAASFARYAVLVVVGIAVLQLYGIQTASLVAVLGATSLAIGLALQGTISDLAAGVILLLFRPFHIGDDVEVAGKARSRTMFLTAIRRAMKLVDVDAMRFWSSRGASDFVPGGDFVLEREAGETDAALGRRLRPHRQF